MRVSVVCCLLVLSALPAAWAGEKEKAHPVTRALSHADSERDGQVTMDELRVVKPNLTPEQFKKLDANADSVLTDADVPATKSDTGFDVDGKVSRDEAQKAMPSLTDDAFDRLDRNDDSVISGQDRQGEGQRARMRDRLHDADFDRDGKVTYQEARQEFPEMTEERFKRFDRSGDGFLTQEDVPKKGERPPMAERMRKADANGDGSVTFDAARAEFPSIDQAAFNKIDSDGDGAVTVRDIAKTMRSPGDSGATDVKQQAAAKALSADVNGDGKVGFDELVSVKPGYPRDAFDRIDLDKDGFVTTEEASKAP